MRKVGIIVIMLIATSFLSDTFKTQQKKFSRVREAYALKEKMLSELLEKKNLSFNQLQLYIRAFKSEQKLELWGKNKNDTIYKLIKTYNICQNSGVIGPKRKQGDLQVPEGYYHIDRFNPMSNFHLSLGINYPNKSDRILGNKAKPGGDIFIHGSCVTIGCLPMTDDLIKELYILCVEAKSNGQSNIPTTIFPTKMTESNFDMLKKKHKNQTDKINLWSDLKSGYDYFNVTKKLPSIVFFQNGRHSVTK